MAGIDFNREAFVARQNQPSSGAPPRVLGSLILVLSIGALGFVGYRLFLDYSPDQHTAEPQRVQELQQQLKDMQKRIEQLEKQRKVVSEPSAILPRTVDQAPAAAPRVSRPNSYKISSASVLQPQTGPNTHLAAMAEPQRAISQLNHSLAEETAVANHEAWQATTERLTDVVGVVGSQQQEISKTREDVNRLLAQTQRNAVRFELRRGAGPEPVGPVSLLLKTADPKNQRYTVCVYVDNQCIELKSRAVDEVVVFAVSSNSVPLELVATKVLRDGIVGYLEVPIEKQAP
jgi:cell division septum initiation protein DivIVA